MKPVTFDGAIPRYLAAKLPEGVLAGTTAFALEDFAAALARTMDESKHPSIHPSIKVALEAPDS